MEHKHTDVLKARKFLQWTQGKTGAWETKWQGKKEAVAFERERRADLQFVVCWEYTCQRCGGKHVSRRGDDDGDREEKELKWKRRGKTGKKKDSTCGWSHTKAWRSLWSENERSQFSPWKHLFMQSDPQPVSLEHFSRRSTILHLLRVTNSNEKVMENKNHLTYQSRASKWVAKRPGSGLSGFCDAITLWSSFSKVVLVSRSDSDL